jgi:ribonuclease-3
MNFIRKIVKSHSQEDQQLFIELKKVLNFSPKNINKYKKAFTHRSVQMLDKKGIPINYERLEFLGDSILGSVIASYLYKKVPTGSEGYLTQMRSKIVSREHLNEIGKDLGLIHFVFSTVPKKNFGEDIHGNIFEALMGAIFLDKGYRYCERFIYKIVIEPYVDVERLEGKITSYKSVLIEWCQKTKKHILYDVYEDTGNDTLKHFSVKLLLDKALVAKGRATSKKKAEEIASKRAFYKFQDQISV